MGSRDDNETVDVSVTATAPPAESNGNRRLRWLTAREGLKSAAASVTDDKIDTKPATTSDTKTAFERKKQRHASGESTISTDSVSRYIPTPPDGGYGWVIVFAAFMNHVIVDGLTYTFGVFFIEFVDYFEESKSKTALVGSLLAGCYLSSAPVASALVNKYGFRPVAIGGALVAFTGFLLSILSPNVDFLMLTYGVIGGFGLGLLYLPNIAAVSYYFQRRRAFATGIAVCGAGVGCFVFAPLGNFLLTTYGWKGSMLFVAGITLNGAVFGALLRPLQPPPRRRRPRAKNVIDRLKEKTAQRIGRPRTESECSGSGLPVAERNRELLKRTQQIKWAREMRLEEEEKSLSDYGSVLNSTRRLDSVEPETPGSGSGVGPSRPIPIPGRRSSASVSGSVPVGSVPSRDVDEASHRGSVVAASFTQSPVRTVSPNELNVDDVIDADKVELGADSELDGLVRSAEAVSVDGRRRQSGNVIGDVGSPVDAASDSQSTLSRRRSSTRSKDNTIPLLTKQETYDSTADYVTNTQQPYDATAPVRRNVSSVSFSTSNVVVYPSSSTSHNTGSTAVNGDARGQGQGQNWLDEESARYAETCRLRLPHGVHRQDYARPLYRSDIFYSGSIIHIPEYRSQLDVENYVRSVTMIPEAVPPDDENCLWRCLPIPKAAKDTLKSMTDLSLVRDPLFLVPFISNLIASIGLYVPFVYISSRAVRLGISESNAADLLMIVGGTNIAGRLISGFCADYPWFNTLLVHNLALLSAGIACFLNMFCTSYFAMCIYAAAFGLFVATWISLTSIVLCELLGLEKLTNAFGLLCMSRGIAAMIGSPIAGAVDDATQNIDAPFHVSGSMLLLGGLLCCLLHLPYFQLRAFAARPGGHDVNSGHGGEVDGSALTADAAAPAASVDVNASLPPIADQVEEDMFPSASLTAVQEDGRPDVNELSKSCPRDLTMSVSTWSGKGLNSVDGQGVVAPVPV